MLLKGHYTIKIEIRNNESDENVEVNTSYTPDKFNKLIEDAKEFISKYDLTSFEICHQCQNSFHHEEFSTPEPNEGENDEISKLKFCQDCLEKIMSGQISLDL